MRLKNSSKKKLAKIREPHFEYYNRFEIQVIPVPVKELSGWGAKVSLWKHKNEKVSEHKYVSSLLSRNEKEAVKHGFEMGKKIIDGTHEKYSVKF